MTRGLRLLVSLTTLLTFFLPLLARTALAASIMTQPAQAPVGTSVTIKGNGWPAGDVIDFVWTFNLHLTAPGVRADNNGNFTTSITVPQETPPGLTYIDAGDQTAFLTAQALFCAGPNPARFEIMCYDTFSEGPLVYFRLYFSDPTNSAVGFGFRGANGSGWGEESHPFSSPSYGRVFPGIIEYPFNQLCGNASEYQPDVAAWIYASAGRQTAPVTIHLACTPFEFLYLPVPFDSISYINWYGNTEFAYTKRTGIYKALQGLHSGIDFFAPLGTGAFGDQRI